MFVFCDLSLHRTLEKIPQSLLPHFKDAAQQLIAEKGAEDALAAALAHISGSKEIVTRSILSGISVSMWSVIWYFIIIINFKMYECSTFDVAALNESLTYVVTSDFTHQVSVSLVPRLLSS